MGSLEHNFNRRNSIRKHIAIEIRLRWAVRFSCLNLYVILGCYLAVLRNRNLLKQIIVIAILLSLGACMHQPFHAPVPKGEECVGVHASFLTDIQPILHASCAKAGCHDGQSMPHDFSVYSELKPVLEDSAFYYYVIKDRSMPQDTVLSEEQIVRIRCWAAQGYPNN